MKNHNDDSAQSVRSSALRLPSTPAPAAPTPAAHAPLSALFADAAFMGTLLPLLRRVAQRDRSELLANVQRQALSSASVPDELEACKSWVAALVRRQADNYRWHGGLPLAPPGITARPTDPKPPTMREQLRAEGGFKDVVAVGVEHDDGFEG